MKESIEKVKAIVDAKINLLSAKLDKLFSIQAEEDYSCDFEEIREPPLPPKPQKPEPFFRRPRNDKPVPPKPRNDKPAPPEPRKEPSHSGEKPRTETQVRHMIGSLSSSSNIGFEDIFEPEDDPSLLIRRSCCMPIPRRVPKQAPVATDSRVSLSSAKRTVESRLENMKVPEPGPKRPDLNAINLSFAARLIIAVRCKFGGEASKVYTAARVSRQAYSQIISDENRPVSKRTAIRFAFALKSTPREAQLLLKSAGYAFSNSLAEDFILQACLEVNPPIWDFDIINQLLAEYNVDFQY